MVTAFTIPLPGTRQSRRPTVVVLITIDGVRSPRCRCIVTSAAAIATVIVRVRR